MFRISRSCRISPFCLLIPLVLGGCNPLGLPKVSELPEARKAFLVDVRDLGLVGLDSSYAIVPFKNGLRYRSSFGATNIPHSPVTFMASYKAVVLPTGSGLEMTTCIARHSSDAQAHEAMTMKESILGLADRDTAWSQDADGVEKVRIVAGAAAGYCMVLLQSGRFVYRLNVTGSPLVKCGYQAGIAQKFRAAIAELPWPQASDKIR